MSRRWLAGSLLILLFFVLPVVGPRLAYTQPPEFEAYMELATTKGRPAYVPGELIVRFAEPSSPSLRSQVLRAHGVTLAETMPGTSFALVRFDPKRDVAEVATALMAEPAIVLAEPNYYRYAHFSPNDPYYSYQWHFPLIQTGQAWDLSTGQGVIVAVIDTGVAYENYQNYVQAPDLAGTAFVPGYDFVNDDTHPNDDQSHGTHVAGTIAQTTNNGLGVAGVAFNAKIMPLKVLDASGVGSSWDLAQALRWAADHGAQVANMSLGSPNSSSVELDAVNYAYNKGVTLVASSGNDGVGSVNYPAAYDQVIAVGAVRYDEQRTSYSNYGNALDLVAPGGSSLDQNGDGYPDGVLQQTFNPNTRDPADFRYYFFQGTSMAAPHVSGVAALIIAKGIATTPDQVRAVLTSTAKDLGSPGWDPYYGYGLVQAAAALGWNGTLPTATPTSPGPSPTPTPSPTPASDFETQVVQLINQERAAQGLPPLNIDSRLVQAARRHSQDMATNNFFDHIGSDGSTPGQRIREAGYNFVSAGETIAGGYPSPSSVVQGWMSSPPHRAILLGDFVDVGVGYVYQPGSYYGHYWTANFASPSGWNPTPTPVPPTPTPSPTATPPHPTPSPQECGDLNNDTVVDARDVQLAAENWRNNASGPDLNGDGVVNIEDVMMIVAQWGMRCVRN